MTTPGSIHRGLEDLGGPIPAVQVDTANLARVTWLVVTGLVVLAALILMENRHSLENCPWVWSAWPLVESSAW